MHHDTLEASPARQGGGPPSSIPAWAAGYERYLVLAAFFAFILVLKSSTLTQPPVWDGAMSVFPAALTLVSDGIDVYRQPAYYAGGPNVHAQSLVTLITAASTAVAGEPPIVFLHLLHFFAAAVAMTTIYTLLRDRAGRLVGSAAALAALLLPIVRVQTGYMYLEIPLLMMTVLAVRAWVDGRDWQAGLWALLAVWVKGPGIIVATALGIATLGEARPDRLKRALWYTPAGILFLGVSFFVRSGTGAPPDTALSIRLSLGYMFRLTDVIALAAVMLAVGVLFAARHSRNHGSGRRLDKPAVYVTILTVLLIFAVSIPGFVFLPRYLTLALPLMVAVTAAWMADTSRIVALAFLGALTAFSLANARGAFYPDNDLENFALIERSEAYTDFLDLHVAASDALARLPSSVPIYYDHPTHYRSTYYQMGYFDSPLSNGVHTGLDPMARQGDINNYPDEFYMYYEQDWLGGEVIQDVWEAADASNAYEVEEHRLARGSFESFIVHVRRVP